MEIMSIGEKIKRARIYKGLTLKDLCGGIISVSKMSCIENDKIVPEDYILEFISKKLDLNLEYLKEDVQDQLKKNISKLKVDSPSDEYVKQLRYNLEVAKEHKYYKMAFNIMHILFNYSIKHKGNEALENLISEYYDICQKSKISDNMTLYNFDIGRYLYVNEEYEQASKLYSEIIEDLCCNNIHNYSLAKAIYYKSNCLIMIHNYDEAIQAAKKIIPLINCIENDYYKAKVYELLAILSIRNNFSKFEEYENRSYDFFNGNTALISVAMYTYACEMYEIHDSERALSYIKKALEITGQVVDKNLISTMIKVIDYLIKWDEISTAEDICDKALDMAISSEDSNLIQKIYYYKALVLFKKNDKIAAEMYINLSLDLLNKHGSSDEMYKRYMDIAKMYHDLGNISDSLKYFTLAISTEKNI